MSNSINVKPDSESCFAKAEASFPRLNRGGLHGLSVGKLASQTLTPKPSMRRTELVSALADIANRRINSLVQAMEPRPLSPLRDSVELSDKRGHDRETSSKTGEI